MTPYVHFRTLSFIILNEHISFFRNYGKWDIPTPPHEHDCSVTFNCLGKRFNVREKEKRDRQSISRGKEARP